MLKFNFAEFLREAVPLADAIFAHEAVREEKKDVKYVEVKKEEKLSNFGSFVRDCLVFIFST